MQYGPWVPIGAEAIAGGYEVAWKVTGSDQYTVWKTDSNGNYTSNLVLVVSGTNPALESLETSFHQDLNGDGHIGLVGMVIESLGSTDLTQVGNNFYLDNSTGVGPSLKLSGADVVAGQFDSTAPGCQSAQRRLPGVMKLRGRLRAPISIRFGKLTATATTPQIWSSLYRERTLHWNRLRPVSTKT